MTAFEVKTLADALGAEPAHQVRWVVDRAVMYGEVTWLDGPPKSIKTAIAIELAIAVATGQQFLGRETTQPGKVLFVSVDTSLKTLAKRFSAQGGNTAQGRENLHLCYAGSSDDHWKSIGSLCAEVQPLLTIVDGLPQTTAVGLQGLPWNKPGTRAVCLVAGPIRHNEGMVLSVMPSSSEYVLHAYPPSESGPRLLAWAAPVRFTGALELL